MLTIWGGATGRTIRAHWMAHELALDYKPKLIGSRTGTTQSRVCRSERQEKIPVLVDGDFVLTESAAIRDLPWGPPTEKILGWCRTEYSRARAIQRMALIHQMELELIPFM